MTNESAAAVSIRNVRKDFGAFTALTSVSFEIADNEFFTLLGPSGCGKTTLLRMIAGFEGVTSGAIFLYEEEIEDLPPDKRPVNTVFQNYALFPHMTVTENIAFGMKMLGWPGGEIATRTEEMISLVKLEQFAARRPAQLSGGQQQRVALARAMAPKPKVLLLDEPLSALDLKLRQEMREELKSLQRETGITFIFVTHDQEEALSMSDRIAVMSAGEVQQIGTPEEIYEHPANRFVADFIGDTNLIEARVEAVSGDIATCRLGEGDVEALAAGPVGAGQSGWLSIRPERVSISAAPVEGGVPATIGASTYLGTDSQVMAHIEGAPPLRARLQNAEAAERPGSGDEVWLSIAPGAARFLTE